MNLINDDALGVADQRRVFRDNLLSKMRERNMRSVDLSRKSKISKDSISSYVTMRSLPAKGNLEKICKALDCKPRDLLPTSTKEQAETVLELREDRRAGYSLLIARIPLPAAQAVEIFSQLLEYRTKLAARDADAEDDEE